MLIELVQTITVRAVHAAVQIIITIVIREVHIRGLMWALQAVALAEVVVAVTADLQVAL